MSENYPKFLKNEPIGEDQFEGKSQEAMAEIISYSLENSDHGIIGIDGSWGSGKSNLVRIVEKKLEIKNYNFFIYDVWGHQEDEQRRTILEEITEFINNKKLVDEVKWTSKLKKLLAKNKETTTKRKPILSLGVILSLFSLLLLPLIKVVGDSIDSNFKYLIYAIPVLILIFGYLYFLYKNRKEKSKIFLHAWNELFELYSKDKIEETTFVTITEDEPSVKKFRDWILEIDKDLKDKKIVVVFDNFDRLPKQKILGLWSSIHIFFAEQKYENIKVIIPFDREHIKNAFGDLNHSSKAKINNTEKIDRKEEFGDYAEDYINKTFDIVYRVAPPIMTNWKSFFEIKWKECFGNEYDKDEFRRTTQVYEILNKKITPREIIVLINEIATLKQIHDNKIPAQYLALFVINKDVILKNPVLEISNPSFINGLEFIYSNDSNLPKYITAIVYQLDPEKSLEIVFEQRLNDALIKKDEAELNLIADSNIFTPILETVYPKISDEFLPNTIETLNSVNSDKFTSKLREDIVWSDLIKRASKLKVPDHNIGNYQKIIISKISDIKEQKDYIKSIVKQLSYDEKWDSINYAKNIDELQLYLNENKIAINCFELLDYQEVDNEDDFILLLKEKQKDYENYKLDVDAESFDKKLENVTVEDLNKINYLQFLNRDEYELEKFNKKLYSDFKNSFTDNKLLPEILRLLKEYNEVINTEDLSDANLYSRFATVTEKDQLYYDFLAIRFSRDLSISGHQSYFSAALNKIDNDYVHKVAKEILNYIDFDDFLLKHEIFKTIPLYKEIVKKLVNDEKNEFGKYKCSLKNILPLIEPIAENTETELDNLIEKLNNWGTTDLNVTSIENLSNEFFTKAVEIQNRLSIKCIELKTEYFDALSKENWIEIFSDLTSEDYNILQTINYNNWSSNAHEAFKEDLVRRTSNITSAEIDNQENFSKMIVSMETKNHKFKNTFEDVREAFIKNNNITNDSFNFFGDWLFKHANLEVDGTMRTIFKNDLLDDKYSIDILNKNIRKFKSLLNYSKDEAQDFKNALSEKSKENDDVKTLGEQLGVIKKTKGK